MDSSERQHLVLERITGVLWFFLCLFGALAAVGIYFLQAQVSSYELFLQWGFQGGVGALIIMGTLQLAKAYMLKEKAILGRLTKVAGFVLSVFGAVLALGLLFTILQYPDAESFLQIGLLGTAGALVLAGSLKLREAQTMKLSGEDGAGAEDDGEGVGGL